MLEILAHDNNKHLAVLKFLSPPYGESNQKILSF